MPSERLQVILELITGQYKREAREAASATGQIGKAAQTTSTGLTNMGKGLSNFGTGLTRNVTLPLAAMAAGAIKAASDLGESVNAIGKVFGDSVGTIAEFGETSAEAVGLSERAFNNLATVTGAVLNNMGFGLQESADTTLLLTQRAADMASVFNTDVPTAMEAVNSAFKGEGNPIEQFGVRITAAAVAAKAVALDLAESTTSVSDYAKAQATLAIIMEQTSSLQGDFAETSDGVANSTRILKAKVEDAAAALGESLLPIVEKLLDKAVDLVDAFNGLSDGQKELVLQTAGLIAIGGPALILIGKLVTAYAALKTALLGAAGAGGVAAAAGWWKVLGLGAVAGLVHREALEIPLSLELDEEGLAKLDEALGRLPKGVRWPREMSDDLAILGDSLADVEERTAGLGEKIESNLLPTLDGMTRGLVDAMLAAQAAGAALQDDLAEGYAAAALSIDKAATNIGVSLSRMETNLEQNLADQLAFYTNLDALADAGLTDLANFLENEGSEKAAGATAVLVGDMERAWNFERMIDQGENDMTRATTALATSLQDGAAAVVDVAYQIGIDLIDQLRAGFSTKDLSDLLGIALGAPGLGPVQGVTTSTGATGGSGAAGYGGSEPRAWGGPVSANQMYLVGERGPEMFVSGTSGSILSNDMLKSLGKSENHWHITSPMNDFRSDLQTVTLYASLVNYVEGM